MYTLTWMGEVGLLLTLFYYGVRYSVLVAHAGIDTRVW
jgi:hypothetical protein